MSAGLLQTTQWLRGMEPSIADFRGWAENGRSGAVCAG